jgi:hypothetical protein
MRAMIFDTRQLQVFFIAQHRQSVKTPKAAPMNVALVGSR